MAGIGERIGGRDARTCRDGGMKALDPIAVDDGVAVEEDHIAIGMKLHPSIRRLREAEVFRVGQ